MAAFAQRPQRRLEIPDEAGVPNDEENLQAIRIVTKQDGRAKRRLAWTHCARALDPASTAAAIIVGAGSPAPFVHEPAKGFALDIPAEPLAG